MAEFCNIYHIQHTLTNFDSRCEGYYETIMSENNHAMLFFRATAHAHGTLSKIKSKLWSFLSPGLRVAVVFFLCKTYLSRAHIPFTRKKKESWVVRNRKLPMIHDGGYRCHRNTLIALLTAFLDAYEPTKEKPRVTSISNFQFHATSHHRNCQT